jgi:carbonic anhydrase
MLAQETNSQNNHNCYKTTGNHESVRLFIVCPFCQLEHVLRNRFGNDIYFITETASSLQFSQSEIGIIKNFVKNEKINHIHVVCDISCNFYEEVINGDRDFNIPAVRELRKLHNELLPPAKRTKEELIKHNILKQLAYLSSEEIFKSELDNSTIKISGMLIDKSNISTSFSSYLHL